VLYVDDPVPALKRQLAATILSLAEDTHPALAGRVLGVDEPRMSDLSRGKLARLSLQQLIRMLANVDCRVVMRVEVPGTGQIRWFALFRQRLRDRHARERP
jgi:predicted XRE-type DNA-binding protein